MIGAPALHLDFLRAQLRKDFATAAQNCYKVPSGAFTGEIRSAFAPANPKHAVVHVRLCRWAKDKQSARGKHTLILTPKLTPLP